ncbi:hypothetical protein Y032_0004g1855 [Ancylostoma ceylanicum]|uniref:Uncharacterized protein n=1 Tax=Ancylostoma ceylanicum TaxID=53326 RepID=A0A016VVZ1_9BILA|nr:hypothetical protein Y032_0004g1855 [Ancylostoma ceylanicum]
MHTPMQVRNSRKDAAGCSASMSHVVFPLLICKGRLLLLSTRKTCYGSFYTRYANHRHFHSASTGLACITGYAQGTRVNARINNGQIWGISMLTLAIAQPPRRRARSEPVRRKDCSQFVRFRSLREAKAERRDRKKPLRIDVVSIASSAESKLRRRKARRERAKRRLEAQLSTSSSSLQSMASDALQPLMVDRSRSSSTSEASGAVTSSAELAQATESPSPSSFAILVNGNGHLESDDIPPSDPEDLSQLPKKVCPGVIDRLHLDLVQLPDSAPNGWFGSVSYVTDMEQFVQKLPANSFVDPFEEEERRSRTEMWVESTSPGYPSENENDDGAVAVEGSEDSIEIPEVKVSECSEKSVSASPPGNTTTSTTGVDEEALPPSVQIHINGELLPTAKIQKNVDRMDSLATSEMSEANSLVSSEVDKISLLKCRFTSNIHHARDDANKEVDFEQIDRFWRYCYNKPETSTEEKEKQAKKDKEGHELNRRRARTPTIERVVLYYTTDRRPSLTPTLSSLSPSPEPFSQRSHLSESGRNLFIQSSPKPSVSQQDSMTSEPIGDIVVPVVVASTSDGKGKEVEGNGEQAGTVKRKPGPKVRKLERNSVVFEEEHIPETVPEATLPVAEMLWKPEDIEAVMENTTFFRLDKITSSEESDEGRVLFEGVLFSLHGFLP